MADTVLIIDDEETLRFSFKNFLEEAGYGVLTAADINGALDILSAGSIDVVFCDILMPEGTGIDVLREVKKQGLHCPVVMVTGEPSIDTASDAVRLGAFDYLPKPVRRDMLLRVCGQALRHKALLDENKRIEREREQYRSDLDLLFTSVSEAIAIIDSEARLLRANAAFCDLFEISLDAALQKPVADALTHGTAACCSVLDRVMEDKTPVRDIRAEWQCSSGRRRVAVIAASPLFQKSSGFAGVALFARDVTRQADLEHQLAERCGFHRLIGKAKRMREIYSLVEALAETDTTVLLTGESGTGKELVAEAIHYASPRAQKPLVKVNCSALSENLLESELFGHVKGAFTGADRDKTGRFQMAQGGTILLDEIGDIAPRLQIKLLRVLQEKEFERVGEAASVKADVRIIASTNSNLQDKIARGEFRSDLYYRLKVVEIDLPPLRERFEDVPLLVNEFCATYNAAFKKNIGGVADEVLAVLLNHSWPGNIRELKHVIEHAFVLCRDSIIAAEHLPAYLVQAAQQQDISATLDKTGGNKAGAARLLGVSRQTVYRKIKKDKAARNKQS